MMLSPLFAEEVAVVVTAPLLLAAKSKLGAGVGVGVFDGVGLTPFCKTAGVGESLGVGVGELVGVGLGISVGVTVGVGVSVGVGAASASATGSTCKNTNCPISKKVHNFFTITAPYKTKNCLLAGRSFVSSSPCAIGPKLRSTVSTCSDRNRIDIH